MICSPPSGFLALWSSHCRAKNRPHVDDSADPDYQHLLLSVARSRIITRVLSRSSREPSFRTRITTCRYTRRRPRDRAAHARRLTAERGWRTAGAGALRRRELLRGGERRHLHPRPAQPKARALCVSVHALFGWARPLASTMILGRRTMPFPPSLIPNRIPHGFTPGYGFSLSVGSSALLTLQADPGSCYRCANRT